LHSYPAKPHLLSQLHFSEQLSRLALEISDVDTPA
jgi:hypothetical protein